jgi:predicted metalloprotease
VDEVELKKAAYLGLNVVASIPFPQEYATMAERNSSTASFPGISSKDVLSDVLRQGAQRMRYILEEGDIEEAMRAAQAIGDDRMQRQSQCYVVLDSFTHGSSEQRARWFRRGLQTGDIRAGDTFNERSL